MHIIKKISLRRFADILFKKSIFKDKYELNKLYTLWILENLAIKDYEGKYNIKLEDYSQRGFFSLNFQQTIVFKLTFVNCIFGEGNIHFGVSTSNVVFEGCGIIDDFKLFISPVHKLQKIVFRNMTFKNTSWFKKQECLNKLTIQFEDCDLDENDAWYVDHKTKIAFINCRPL